MGTASDWIHRAQGARGAQVPNGRRFIFVITGATPYPLLKFSEIVGDHVNGHAGASKRTRTEASAKPLASREKA